MLTGIETCSWETCI